MAVQAQYPSNVLLLNNNNNNLLHQDNKTKNNNSLPNDYSLQPRPGGAAAGEASSFLDQSQMLIYNAVGTNNNTRKRGREISATESSMPINHFSMQSQPPQLIDLTLLHTPQPNVVSTGLRLAFGDQQQQQQQQLQHHHHQQRQQQQQSTTLSPQSSSSSVLYSLLSEDLSTQIRQQRDEIERFLHAQGEQLRRTLAEKRQRHYHALLGAAEESVARRLREKEAEAEKAARRHAELEARAAQLTAEAQAWRAKAAAQEAAALALEAQLQHAIMSRGCARTEEGGARLSCADGQAEDAESAYVDPDRPVGEPVCKGCRRRVATVVVLPCRHFCLCTECDTVAQSCPICLSFKNSSVEVFLS